jgi:FAD:protein FMN transferase
MHWTDTCAAALLVVLAAMSTCASDAATSVVHKKKYAMGTVFEIVAYDSSPARASAAIDQAFAEIVRLDELLSNYNAESELSHLNRDAHFQAQAVSPDLYRVLEQSVQYSKISGGRFDVTVAPLVDLWKAALRNGSAPSAEQESEARNCVGYQKIDFFPPNQIEFRSPCLRIDVGAIGKGYALDRAAEVLQSLGVSRALLDAGGSTIFALGSPPGKVGWLVHMRDPSGRLDPQIMLADESLSTSEQTPPGLLQDSSAGHIIDPETGLPLRSSFAVSVVAKTATASDALSTTLLLLGPEAGKGIVQNTAESAAIWVAPTGETELVSSGPKIVVRHDLQSRCRSNGELGVDGCH